MRCLSVANKTNNYKLPKPEADDFYDISEYNKTMDMLDDSLTEMDEKKLDKNGDASEAVTEFEQEILRENIESGETLSSTFGKVKKWFSEMKDVAFSGHAKDVATDAAHRFVSDAEKSSWNGKVEASGGDISDTVIGTLETVDSKYPVPNTGETAKAFMGKVKKFIDDTKPLNAEMFVEVANSGSDTTGDGTLSKPYRTIQYALNTIPKDLNGYIVTIRVGDGTYNEEVHLSGYKSGSIIVRRNGPIILNAICNIQSIYVSDCHSVSIQGINLTSTGRDCVTFYKCYYAEVLSCSAIQGSVGHTAFTFDNVNNGKIIGCMSQNFDTCLKVMGANIFSDNWDPASAGSNYGYTVSNGGTITRGGGFQPRGYLSDEFIYQTAGVIVNQFGAKIGTLLADLSIYVSPSGSDKTGNGSSSSPFATIQHAINVLPKDLGGHYVTINVAVGTYNEDIRIECFRNGDLNIFSANKNTLVDTCKINSAVFYCCGPAYVRLNGFNMVTTTKNAIQIGECDGVYIDFCQSTTNAGERTGVQCYESSHIGVSYCKMANKNHAASFTLSSAYSANWDAGSTGNKVGISSYTGSSVTVVGTQPVGKSLVQNGNGGSFIRWNGTQISDITNAGLSCTWGIIGAGGGYFRHGNVQNGTAVVTVTMNIENTVPLSAGTQYTISGFPPNAGVINTAVTFGPQYLCDNCFIDMYGSIQLWLKANVAAGAGFALSVTYQTNS